MSFDTPILFIIFNRPDTTTLVFEEIRKQKPKRLFIAADGARTNKPEDITKCAQSRNIVSKIDWDCDVRLLFREENLGCGKAVSSAISWFFEHVEEGIILEDDCLPHSDFFEYCKQLLEYHRFHEQVMFIGGSNFQNGKTRGNASYYFSAISHVWGWATWKRVWEKYDFSLNSIDKKQIEKNLTQYFSLSRQRNYWIDIFNIMKTNPIDTWDHQLTFTIWNLKGLSIIPNVNLITNIGFGENATHTKTSSKLISNRNIKPIIPLSFNNDIKINIDADIYFYKKFIKPTFKTLVVSFLSKIKRKLL